MKLTELQLDGLIGPTHNYAGLSAGNVASTSHRGDVSRPREAALQGLDKMAFVASLGIEQAIMPPHHRPDIDVLRSLGISGTDDDVLAAAKQEDHALLAQVSSASAMWTANAATVTPSCDAADARVHFTPANLRCKFHRAIEPAQTGRLLQAIFPNTSLFAHHSPLPGADQYGDEGAANHTRLVTSTGEVHLFVYGVHARDASMPAPHCFPARQTYESSQAVARLHKVRSTVFAQQNPQAIDAGVFHNDVISVGTDHVLLMHEDAFVKPNALLSQLHEKLGDEFSPLVVSRDALTMEEAVKTYLFNSQLVRTTRGLELVAPIEAGNHARSRSVVEQWIDGDGPIVACHYLDVRESMRNGGGPACLRLRVPLNDEELSQVTPGVRWSEDRHATLRAWVERWYPETLSPADLADPTLGRNSQDALDALTTMLGLGPIYPFQL
jgi:succinylarginine dihydrolase